MSFGSSAFGSVAFGGLNVVSGDVTLALSGTSSIGNVSGVTSAQTILKGLFGVSTEYVGNSGYDSEEYDSEIYSETPYISSNQAVVVPISGVFTEARSGLFLSNIFKALAGISSTEAVSSFTTSQVTSTALVGVSSTEAVSSFTASQVTSTALTCVSSTEAVSSFTASQVTSTALTGVQSIVSTGVETGLQNTNQNLVGVSTNYIVGQLSTEALFALTGVSANSIVGQLSTEALFALTGVSTSATLENVLKQISQDLTGVTSTSGISATGLSVDNSASLMGVESIDTTGLIASTGGQPSVIISLAGVQTETNVSIVFPEIEIGLTSVASTSIITNIHVIGDFPEITGYTQDVSEYVPFTVSWPVPGPISSFAISEPIPGVELYSLGNNVYAAGQTDDVLERTIEYVDSNLNLKIVSKFTDLPNGYYDITKYTAPQAQEKLFYINVNYYDEVLLETKTVVNCLTVHYNYTSSNQSLKDAAKKVLV